MNNMNSKRNEMPTQDPKQRAHNFNEVALGYDEATAVDEALRCLNCKNPACVAGCPVNIHIPEFISKVKASDFEGAYEIISKTSSLPAVCGRVCPQETQCEAKCVRGIKGEPVAMEDLSALLPIGIMHTVTKCPKPPKVTAKRLQLSAPVRRD